MVNIKDYHQNIKLCKLSNNNNDNNNIDNNNNYNNNKTPSTVLSWVVCEL